MTSTMNNPITGVQYFINGFKLIAQPGLRRFVAIPLMINIILFTLLFLVLRHYMGEFNLWFEHFLPTWLHWLSGVLWLLFFVSFFLVIIFTFVTIANIVCAPFNTFLAEKVELYLTGKMPEPRTLIENIKDIPRILGRQLGIIGYYIPRALLILILFLIPVVHLIAVVLWFLFNAWVMTMTYIDYPTDNHRVPFKEVRDWMRQKRYVSLGFGISVMVASMIPILNFFTIPAAVAGATQFWIKESN